MASAKILKRAETAMEIGEDFLLSDEDDDDDADEGSENCGEHADAEGEGEDEAEDETKSNASGPVKTNSGPKDDSQDENASTSTSTMDDKTKKSGKSVAKTLKSLMEDAKSPFGKWQWNVYLHFAASNRASRRNHRRRQTLSKSDGAADRKKTTRPPKDEVKNNSSIAGAEIKRLRLENKLLTKLANKFLDEYIKLKTRNGELSEVQGQLMACRRSNDSLKTELQELQSNRESLRQEMSKQSEEHRVAVNQLNEEIKKITEDLSRMDLEKKCIEAKHKKSEDALSSTKKRLENLSSVRDILKLELIKQTKRHSSESEQITESLNKLQNMMSKLIVNQQDGIKPNKKTEVGSVEMVKPQQNILSPKVLVHLEYERDTLQSKLNRSNAKVNDLRLAIAVLFSIASTSTPGDIANDGLFKCLLCGQEFGSLANMQLHADGFCP